MSRSAPTVAVIGGGPAGLMAAQVLAEGGAAVVVHDRMPTVGRKFLMAGRGGLNLTHSEDPAAFKARYGAAADRIAPLLDAFPPAALVAWAEGLGQETFTGSSGRVFPRAMKASPLLRAWLARLEALDVTLKTRSEWLGWTADGALRFRDPAGETVERPDAVILALGGASWARLACRRRVSPWPRSGPPTAASWSAGAPCSASASPASRSRARPSATAASRCAARR